MTLILGINAFHGDASAALVNNGELVAAAAEERFNRKKHAAGFPSQAIAWCLREAGAGIEMVEHVAVSRNPEANLFDKILFTLKKKPSFNSLARERLKNAMKFRNIKGLLARSLVVEESALSARLHNVEHHRAHLASAFFVGPFDQAAVLSLDGFGDFVSTMWGRGIGNRIEVFDRVEFPHSLGIVYTALTQWLGFPRYGDEGKVMGLAACGKPRYLDEMRRIVRNLPGGRFELDLGYFVHHSDGVSMTWDDGSPSLGGLFSDKLVQLFGLPREPGGPYTEHVRDVAASLQAWLEETIFHVVRHVYDVTGLDRLCLAGGVALNSCANGKILDNTPFEELFVQPAAGDDGTAIGAAYYVWNQILRQPRGFAMLSAATGPAYDNIEVGETIAAAALEHDTSFDVTRIDDDAALVERAAQHVADGKVVGWFDGRMEFGPRALGNRSIVVDARRQEMKDTLNARIKHREAFRPFAPSVLSECTGEFFERDHPSPHMLMVYSVRPEKRDLVPATTHVDGTGRLQTVDRSVCPRYWALIDAYRRRTGVGLVLNTSFNENEPIVMSPQHALDCFLKTNMDVLVMESWVIERKQT